MNKIKLISILAMLLMFSACCSDDKPVCDPVIEKAAIKLALQKYVIANEARNISLISELWANDSAVLSIGTDRHDVLRGAVAVLEKFKEQYRYFEDTYISATNIDIYVHPSCETAWFSEVLQYNYTQGEKAIEYSDLRFTGFMEKRNGAWVIMHTHLSEPADK
ncbi:MAG: nuclear transport factor 2 family protein [Lentimicrobium sp.]|jgi:ketosteroid isomerase-like protein|nr:nuclear transport factor 2 family protein [Lentimicrobium sp.]